jgi:hypothetical protein
MVTVAVPTVAVPVPGRPVVRALHVLSQPAAEGGALGIVHHPDVDGHVVGPRRLGRDPDGVA